MANTRQVATTHKELATAAPGASTEIERFTPGKSHGVIARTAARFGVDSDKMLETLKQTAFRQRPGKNGAPPVPVTNEQMMMLLVVADEYHLNPFTREIYAFPQEGGIVPIVSVDGWIRIINEHPQIDSLEFESAPSGTEDPWITCTLKRKDRTKPTAITEYLSECSRNTDPWNQMPRRMLRHKALIQCARVAFGFAGIFDPDEGEKIVSIIEQGNLTPRTMKPATRAPEAKAATHEGAAAMPCINLDQQTALTDALSENEVPVDALLTAFAITNLAELRADEYPDARSWIDNESKGG